MRVARGSFTKTALIAGSLLVGHGTCSASDGVYSELSHVISGGLVAGYVTKYADDRGWEDRRWVGFATSVGISLVAEGVQVLTSDNRSKQFRSSALDFTANMVGAAIGAWVTDRYILAPVISRDAMGHRKVGVALNMAF
jgi:hypothetical protein